MTTAWRLVKVRHQAGAFSGEGARIVGGRWNLPGTRVVYASESLALAALETLVHLGSAAIDLRFVAFRITIPEHLTIEATPVRTLPRRWRNQPPLPETMEIGTRWTDAGRAVCLRVPSVVVPRESNFLLNPAHPEFRRITIDPPEPFTFDPRLWKASA
jgi:RES domain-containing protein